MLLSSCRLPDKTQGREMLEIDQSDVNKLKPVGIYRHQCYMEYERSIATRVGDHKRLEARKTTSFDELRNLTASGTVSQVFVVRMVKHLGELRRKESGDEYSCPSCGLLLLDPVTMACGHSFCKKCIVSLSQCTNCNSKVKVPASLCTNILLTTLLRRLHSVEYTCRSLFVNDNGFPKYLKMINSAAQAILASKPAPQMQDVPREERTWAELLAIKSKRCSGKLQNKTFGTHSPGKKRRAVTEEFLSNKKRLTDEDVTTSLQTAQEVDEKVRLSGPSEKARKTESGQHNAGISTGTDESSISPDNLECSICMRLYFKPVCTSCGHSFCKECLERCSDHNSPCPLCRKPIVGDNIQALSIDVTSQAMIKRYLSEEYNHRLKQHEAEIQQLKKSVPIFVCTTAFPSVPCLLHIYEPRYRLMLRRVLDIHDKEFGMCAPAPNKPFHKFGIILKVRKASFLPDGRSIVESVGLKRIEVINSNMCDGYNTAQVKYIVDKAVKTEEIEELNKMLDLVYKRAESWYKNIGAEQKEKISKHFGVFPTKDYSLGENGPDWAWWVLAVLPVEDKVKVNIFSKCLLRERLLYMYKILKVLQMRGKTDNSAVKK